MISTYENLHSYSLAEEHHCVVGPMPPESIEDVKTIAASINYNVLIVQFNALTFGSACDYCEIAAILLNPYVKLVTKPILPKIEFRRTVYEAILPIVSTDDDPMDDNEMLVCRTLPNGWATYDYELYYRPDSLWQPLERKFYRPWSGQDLRAHYVTDGRTILHPWLPRALTSEEMNAILTHTGFNWLEEYVINESRIADEPATNIVQSIDFSSSAIENRFRVKVENSFANKEPNTWRELLSISQ